VDAICDERHVGARCDRYAMTMRAARDAMRAILCDACAIGRMLQMRGRMQWYAVDAICDERHVGARCDMYAMTMRAARDAMRAI
jgi:hypothetical protein